MLVTSPLRGEDDRVSIRRGAASRLASRHSTSPARSAYPFVLTGAISRLVGLVVAVILAVAVLVLRDAMSGTTALELGRSAERLGDPGDGHRYRAGRRRARRRRGLG